MSQINAVSPELPVEELPQAPTADELMDVLEAADEAQETKALREFDRLARRQYAGPWHSTSSEDQSSLLKIDRPWYNLEPYSEIREVIRTYQAHLFGQHVDPMLDPTFGSDQASTKMRELRLSRMLDDIGFDQIDNAVVLDAMFSRGCYYIGPANSLTRLAIPERGPEPGEPVVFRVGVGDLTPDPNASTYLDWAYVSHRFVVPRGILLDTVDDAKAWQAIEQLQAVHEDTTSIKDSSLPIGSRSPKEDEFLEDYIALRECCFRYKGRKYCCVVPGNVRDGGSYIVEPYPIDDELEGHRYEVLDLNEVPGSNVPLSPAMAVMEIHLAKVRSMARMVRQMWNYRRGVVYGAGAADAVGKLQDPHNEDSAFEGDAKDVAEIGLGGIADELMRGWALLDSVGQKIGPNLGFAGGKSDPSNSATAASLLAGNASQVIGYWKQRVDTARANVLRRLSAMLDSSGDEMVLPMQLPDGQTVAMVWDYQSQDVSYDQFVYKVRPYRTDSMDPRMRARSIIEAMQIVGPFLTTVAQLGGNVQMAMSVLADATGTPELLNIFPTGGTEQLRMRVMQMLANKAGALAGGQMPRLGAASNMQQARSDYAPGVPS